MIFEFNSHERIGAMRAFVKATGSTIIAKGHIVLPPSLGNGYMKGFDFGPNLRMMLHHYELKEELIYRRSRMGESPDTLTLTFHNTQPRKGDIRLLPAVQLPSPNLPMEVIFPANTLITTIMITIEGELLKDLLNNHSLLQQPSYLYEEIISPEIQNVAAHIITPHAPAALLNFYLRLKAEELIYLFFVDLQKRQHTTSYALNGEDVKLIYNVRNEIINDLSITPNVKALALQAGMSESKIQRLFKQIFGDSIYNYYQTLRMKEAAYLIKEQQLSVSETGYKLGFSNLSHFTRLFEKHIGMKPKKYSYTN
ncbi:response regulator transcription factor [[Flexibacter] sp. ATCC 35208]|uniref:helix-turn-helix transcriptional regulator n=1 Tax=[Flexibacter] sp. ATCC 35208 TaxID=1936242 RepID=UPI0009F85061|nr:response regulator transcription factor [[Flexibacter] sp. ATCC 35208]